MNAIYLQPLEMRKGSPSVICVSNNGMGKHFIHTTFRLRRQPQLGKLVERTGTMDDYYEICTATISEKLYNKFADEAIHNAQKYNAQKARMRANKPKNVLNVIGE